MIVGSVPLDWPSAWKSAEDLAMLEGSPFDTLLLEASTPPEIRSAAEKRGLKCVVPGQGPVRWQAWTEVEWKDQSPVVAIGDAFWPSLASAANRATSEAVSGPTGAPWLDANGWLILMARARAPQKAIWLKSAPPEKPDSLDPRGYALSAMEAFAYGASRVTWLTPGNAASLQQKTDAAMQWWKQLCELLSWTRSHDEWRAWSNPAKLLIVSDFVGPNEYLASETMLLAARRNLAFEPVETSRLTAQKMAGRKAVLWMDEQEVPALLARFASEGGLVICRQKAAKPLTAGKPLDEPSERFKLSALGKGRVAVGTADWDDPWVLAQDAHMLVSRRWDPVRLFNSGSLQFHSTVSPDRTRQMVHLVNYTMRPPVHQVSVMVTNPVKSARIHIAGKEAALAAEVVREPGRQEIHVPAFPFHLAVELESTRHA